MKIGFCAALDRIEQAAAAGFDYIEPPISAMAAWTEQEFEKKLALAKKTGLPVLSFNVMFPGEIALLSPATKDEDILSYLHPAFSRVEALGGKIAVFGSGKSRTRPECLSYGEAFRRLSQVGRLIGEAAKCHGITAVVEPLHRGETNMINSVAEGADLVAAANHPNLCLLADYYHIAVEKESPDNIVRVGGVSHVHLANEAGRSLPLPPEEGMEKMFTALKKTNYQGAISLECKCDDLLNDGAKALKMIRELWEAAPAQ